MAKHPGKEISSLEMSAPDSTDDDDSSDDGGFGLAYDRSA
jgi:hypothetical protein